LKQNFAEFCRILRNFAEFYGILWNFAEFCGILWNFVEFCGILWNLVSQNIHGHFHLRLYYSMIGVLIFPSANGNDTLCCYVDIDRLVEKNLNSNLQVGK
jgi:hypothetical protein